jgi:Sigma-70 region 2
MSYRRPGREAPVYATATSRKRPGMTHEATSSVVRQLETRFDAGSSTGLSDRELLERYTTRRHESAGEDGFAAVVGRHGPMVLGICRQLLGDVQHAEDAFQAVFLVLARKA